jgi:hypothetical protein
MLACDMMTYSKTSARRTRGNRGKGKLKEPILKTKFISFQEKALVADKGCSISTQITTIGKGITDSPKGDTSSSSIQ